MIRPFLFESTLAISVIVHALAGLCWTTENFEPAQVRSVRSGKSSIRLRSSIAVSPTVPKPEPAEVFEKIPIPEPDLEKVIEKIPIPELLPIPEPELVEVFEEIPIPELLSIPELFAKTLPIHSFQAKIPDAKTDSIEEIERPERTPEDVPIQKSKTVEEVSNLPSPASKAQTGADVLPKKLPNNSAPEYPLAAREAQVEGRVVLCLFIDAEGKISTISVHDSSGSSLLDDSALLTCRNWRFTAARRNGTPVSSEMLYAIRFEIER